MSKLFNFIPSLFIMAFTFSAVELLGQNKVEVCVSMANKNMIAKKDLGIKISIISNTLDTILIPKTGGVCYPEDRTALLGLQLQEMKSEKYVDINPTTSFDNLPSVEADTLTKGSHRLFEFPIAGLSEYPLGKYRIRILTFFSLYNKMKDVYSNWAYFEINTPLKEN